MRILTNKEIFSDERLMNFKSMWCDGLAGMKTNREREMESYWKVFFILFFLLLTPNLQKECWSVIADEMAMAKVDLAEENVARLFFEGGENDQMIGKR